MNTMQDAPGTSPSSRQTWLFRSLRKTALLVVALLMSTPALAVYVPDTTYNGGQMTSDRFASTHGDEHLGRKAVKLSNGDVVLIGTTSAYPHQYTGQTNYGGIGLALRGPNGQPKPWPNPAPNHTAPGEPAHHIVIPGTASSRIDDVKGAVVRDDLIFVLVDETNRSLSPNFHGARIYVIGTDGRYKNQALARSMGVSGSRRTVTAGDLVAWRELTRAGPILVSKTYIAAVAEEISGQNTHFALIKYEVNTTDGTLTPIYNRRSDSIFPGECGNGKYCTATSIALGGPSASGPGMLAGGTPKLYVAGSTEPLFGSSDVVFAARVSTTTGDGLNFDRMSNGSRCIAPGGTGPGGLPIFHPIPCHIPGTAHALVVKPRTGNSGNDILYTMSTAKTCSDNVQDGIIVSRFDPTVPGTGTSYPGFTMKFLSRSGDNPETSPCSTSTRIRGHAMVTQGNNTLAVAGTLRENGSWDAFFTALDIDTLSTTSPISKHEFKEQVNGQLTRVGGSTFRSAVPLDDNRLLLAGLVRIDSDYHIPAVRDKRRYISMVLKNNVSYSDPIFFDGFE